MHAFFVERKERLEVVLTGQGPVTRSAQVDAGACASRYLDGGTRHQWRDAGPPALALLPDHLRTDAAGLMAGAGQQALSFEPFAMAADALDKVGREAGAQKLHVLLQQVRQRILCASDEAVRIDLRTWVVAEVRVMSAERRLFDRIWRCVSFPDSAGLAASVDSLGELTAELAALLRTVPQVPCPSGSFPVLFPPGAAAASFFHEVCGHPLEGDVVSRGGSYLAGRQGEQVAPEFFSVYDGPTGAAAALPMSIDDEGHPAQRTAIIDCGRVGTPLLDRTFSQITGRPGNGHGRRVSYRFNPIPRMSHTEVAPHRGRFEAFLAEMPQGLLVQHLVPRHMNLLSGDFSFYMIEAREIRDGRPGAFLGPGILRGNALEALREIDAVGEDSVNLLSTRGCRKVDHDALAVSFGQPAVRFRRLRVEPLP